MTLRPCIVCGKHSDQTRCPAHRRGSRQQRGYDANHDAERAAWTPHVEAGLVTCRRVSWGLCVADNPVIQPGEAWDLGHPDAQCPTPRAPEHRRCNRGAPRRSQ